MRPISASRSTSPRRDHSTPGKTLSREGGAPRRFAPTIQAQLFLAALAGAPQSARRTPASLGYLENLGPLNPSRGGISCSGKRLLRRRADANAPTKRSVCDKCDPKKLSRSTSPRRDHTHGKKSLPRRGRVSEIRAYYADPSQYCGRERFARFSGNTENAVSSSNSFSGKVETHVEGIF